MALLIRGGRVLSAEGPTLTLEPADVLVEGDRIEAVGRALAGPVDARVLDASGRLVLPGLVNAHTQTVRFPHQPEQWLDARTVWTLATTGSARVLGLADELGAIAPGRKADLVLLRADSVFLHPLSDPVNALVYAETGADVDTVVVDGRVVVEAGRVTTVDESRIYARAQEAADRQYARSAAARGLAGQLTPYIAAACRAAVATPYPVNRYAAPIPTPA